MTRVTIYETPENREQYAEVRCEYFDGVRFFDMLLWRIYREVEQPAPDRTAPITAAEPAIKGDPTTPETVTDKGSGAVVSATPTDAGAEREQAARPCTSNPRIWTIESDRPKTAIRTLSRAVSGEIYEAFRQCHGDSDECSVDAYSSSGLITREGHRGLRLCIRCFDYPDEVHFHNEAIV